jgi:cobalt-zinc-cadmium efflux system protein
MNVLSLMPFVRNGHFDWCPRERTIGHHDCQRCQGQLYFFALCIAVLVAVLEFWGGGHTGSVSLVSDAWHVLSDGFGYLIGAAYAALILYRVRSPETREQLKHLCEFLLGGFLVITAFSIGGDAIGRWWHGHLPVIEHGVVLFLTAGVGLIANVVLLLLFFVFGVGHSHDHGTKHHHEHGSESRILSGNFWHTFTDTVSSVLVMANGIIFSFTHDPRWWYLDLVVTLIITIVLLEQGVSILAHVWKKKT